MDTKSKAREEVIDETDTLRKVVVQFPETVNECHKQIAKLKQLLINTRDVISERDEEIGGLRRDVIDLEEEASEEEARAEDSVVSTVNALLDECERVGVRRYRVPETDRVNAALLELHSLAGRNP